MVTVNRRWWHIGMTICGKIWHWSLTHRCTGPWGMGRGYRTLRLGSTHSLQLVESSWAVPVPHAHSSLLQRQVTKGRNPFAICQLREKKRSKAVPTGEGCLLVLAALYPFSSLLQSWVSRACVPAWRRCRWPEGEGWGDPLPLPLLGWSRAGSVSTSGLMSDLWECRRGIYHAGQTSRTASVVHMISLMQILMIKPCWSVSAIRDCTSYTEHGFSVEDKHEPR
jgi:hypothetical protein